MTNNAKKYLFDILKALQEIEEIHLSEISTQSEYESSSSTIKRAVERELQIIGEAAFRLKQMDFELTQADSLINRRNTIIHQYDSFQPRTIWNFIIYQMPAIKEEVSDLLNE